MAAPFSDPLTLDDYRAAALVLGSIGSENLYLAGGALEAIEPGLVVTIQKTNTTPLGIYVVSDDLVIVAVSGTVGLLQWVLHFLGSAQNTVPPYPGRVSSYFGGSANVVRAQVEPGILDFFPTRRLVLIGHSFGGAIVQCLLAQWGPLAGNGAVCITFGCPRVGDHDFAASIDSRTTRIEDTFDPIVCVPPTQWAGEGSPWVWPFGLQPATYEHAGTAFTLTDAGELQPGEQHIPLQQVWGQLIDGAAPTHEISEYIRRLGPIEEPPQVDFADPLELDAVGEFLSPAGGIGGQGVATTQGIMFVNTTEEPAGWGESWFCDTNVPDMNNKLAALLPSRAAFLASTCQIVAYRSSNVDPTQPRQSRLVRLQTPVKGSVDAGSIKAPQLKTNETMDAIDFQVKSVTNQSSKIAFFRGVPDDWIQGSALTPEGMAGLPVIQSFLLNVKNATMGLRVYNRGGGFPIKPMASIAQDALTKLILVTAPGHGLPVPPALPVVTIRRCKSNPMLNGKWKVSVVDPNTFLLVGSNKFYVNASGDGTFQLYGTQVDVIDTYQFDSVSTRKTGAPFGRRRGKRSPRLLHH